MNKKFKNIFAKLLAPINKAYTEIDEREELKKQNKNIKVLSIGAKVLIGAFVAFLCLIALVFALFDIDLFELSTLFLGSTTKSNKKLSNEKEKTITPQIVEMEKVENQKPKYLTDKI